MFLKLYDLIKLPIVSAASRNVYKFVSQWSLQTRFKKLSLYKSSKAGRNSNGKLIIRTKTSSLLKHKRIKINYHFRLNCLGFISNFQIIPFRNKIVSLVYFANGGVTYYQTSQYHHLFSFIFFNKHKLLKRFFNKFYHTPFSVFSILCRLKKLSFVSLVELTPGRGAQYARSNGTRAKLMRFDKNAHTVLIQLPSRVKKVFSYYSFASLDQVVADQHKNCFNSKSGYWRSFGVKSIVRGVAMNPVDHPHGGRTKAIKYPRTPWGKTTKYK